MTNPKKVEDGGPAFPAETITRTPTVPSVTSKVYHPGMTLRDYFAGQALVGILSGPASRDGASRREWFDIPADAYAIADAMLKARTPND